MKLQECSSLGSLELWVGYQLLGLEKASQSSGQLHSLVFNRLLCQLNQKLRIGLEKALKPVIFIERTRRRKCHGYRGKKEWNTLQF